MMIALYILLSILLIIVFILCSNISVFFKFIDEKIYLKAGVYGIYLWILNPDDEDLNEEKKNTHEDKKQEIKKQVKDKKKEEIKKEKNSFLDLMKNEKGKIKLSKIISFFFNISKSTFPGIKNLIKKIKIKKLDIKMSIGATDAFETAILYTHISNGLNIIVGYLKEIDYVKIKNIEINPDFVRGDIRYDISFYIKLRIGTILWEGLKALITFVNTYLKQNNKKGSVKNVIRKSSKRSNGEYHGQNKTNG